MLNALIESLNVLLGHTDHCKSHSATKHLGRQGIKLDTSSSSLTTYTSVTEGQTAVFLAQLEQIHEHRTSGTVILKLHNGSSVT